MNCTTFAGACLLASLVLGCGAGPRAVRQQMREEQALAAQNSQTDEPFQVSASHILIAFVGAERAADTVSRTKPEAEVLAQQVLERVQAGEDFAALAQEFSDGPSGPNGGALGSFSRSKMTQAFSDAAFSLEPGALYPEPVETEFGFHIIRRDH